MRTDRSSRNAIAAALLLTTSFTAYAQKAFEKGTSAINLGLGIGGYNYSYLSYYNNTSASPTFCFSYELGLAELGPDVLGIGLMAGHNWRTYKNTSSTYTYTYEEKESWTNTLVGVRAMYHFNWFHDINKLDLYAGVMTGYSFGKHKDESTRRNNFTGEVIPYNQYNYIYNLGSFRTGAFIGVRYYFTNFLGVYAEAGYSVALLNGGLSLKF